MNRRVLLYVQHLLGVGHVKRAAAISDGLKQAGLEVTVAYGGMPVPGITFPGANVVQLPAARSADATFSGLIDADGTPLSESWWQTREQRLLEIFSEVAPALILVEHFPFGRRKFQRELVPMFKRARSTSNCKIVGSVRDILIAPTDETKTNKMITLAQDWFDSILVHSDPSVIRLEDTFPAANQIADKLTYTGYIVDQQVNRSDTDDGFDEVIVSAGGGAVGANLFRTAMDARLAGCLADRTWRFLAGGNLDPEIVHRLRSDAPNTVIVENARPDFPTLLQRAALSISQGGYNTMMDLLTSRCPAIVVPFATGGETEQTFRAEKFANANLMTHLPECDLTPQRLAETATKTMTTKKKISDTIKIDLNGRAATGRLVAEMMH